ncbi:hypothetical protein Tco_1219240 [Tanacetum coccineum]
MLQQNAPLGCLYDDDDGGGVACVGGMVMVAAAAAAADGGGEVAWRSVVVGIGYIYRRGGMLELAGKIPPEKFSGGGVVAVAGIRRWGSGRIKWERESGEDESLSEQSLSELPSRCSVRVYKKDSTPYDLQQLEDPEDKRLKNRRDSLKADKSKLLSPEVNLS